MRKPRALNRLGVWLCHELNRRNLSKAEFAFLIGTTPQNLSDILRGNRFAEDTLKKWERKCRQALNDMDGIAAVGCEASVSYQIVCSMVEIEGTGVSPMACRCWKTGLANEELRMKSRIFPFARRRCR